MPAIEFIAMLGPSDVAWLLALQLIFFALLYWTVSSRQSSIVDPFTVPLLFAASAWSTVVFLYLSGLCSTRMFVTFVLTGIAYLVGYRWVAPRLTHAQSADQAPPTRKPIDHAVFMQMGAVVTLLVLGSIAINIFMFGLGIEHENRLEIYSNSAGFGVLKRVNDALMPVSIFFLTYVVTRKRRIGRVIPFATLLFLAAYTVLDGSKSGLVSIFLIVAATLRWLHLRIDGRIRPISAKTAIIAVMLALIVAALVLTMQLDAFADFEKFMSGLVLLFYRVTLAADIYILGFPNDSIDRIAQTSAPLLVLFQDPLSTLRLASLDVIPIGTQLYNYLTISHELSAGGPNAHLGIYSYYLFGEYFSPIFCLFVGMAIGAVRKIYSRRSISLVHGACATAVMVNTAYALVDPSYMIHRITNLALFLFPIYMTFHVRGLVRR